MLDLQGKGQVQGVKDGSEDQCWGFQAERGLCLLSMAMSISIQWTGILQQAEPQ